MQCLPITLFTVAMSLLQNCKLTYFAIPGRGEATRLALAIGGIQFTDERIQFNDWPSLKPSTPWGSMPILTLSNGQEVAQQHAILRLVGKEIGLYPTDSFQAALVDSLIDACEDLTPKINNAGRGLPKEEKEAERIKAMAKGGAVYNVFQKVEDFISKHGKKGYTVGDSLTIADVFLFTSCGGLVSGLFDGVPPDALDHGDFPNISAVRKTVRAHHGVVKWYDGLDKSIKMPASFGPF